MGVVFYYSRGVEKFFNNRIHLCACCNDVVSLTCGWVFCYVVAVSVFYMRYVWIVRFRVLNPKIVLLSRHRKNPLSEIIFFLEEGWMEVRLFLSEFLHLLSHLRKGKSNYGR